jgi:hypothetical protein
MAKQSSAGGGINSKNVVRKPVRVGERGCEIRPAGVSQIGSSLGNHTTDGKLLTKSVEAVHGAYRPAGSPGGVPLGNQIATNVGRGSPGAGRQVMRSGSQGTHGSPNPGNPPPAGELFPGWPAKGRT